MKRWHAGSGRPRGHPRHSGLWEQSEILGRHDNDIADGRGLDRRVGVTEERDHKLLATFATSPRGAVDGYLLLLGGFLP